LFNDTAYLIGDPMEISLVFNERRVNPRSGLDLF
jgi:hypothetical protein